MKIEKLNQHPDMIATAGTWWYDEWSRLFPDSDTAETVTRSLRDTINKDETLPHILIAIENGEAIGTAALKLHELRNHFPDIQHWLGSVYVRKSSRQAGVAAKLVNEVEQIARSMSIPTLHLQTEQLDGGLYKRLGWQPVTQLRDRGGDILVMNKQL